MKKMKKMIYRSFSLRMSLSILLVAGSVFIVAFLSYFHQARQAVSDEAVAQAKAKLDNTIVQIDKVLNSVEVALENLKLRKNNY